MIVHKQWLRDFYKTNPLGYLDEAQAAFKRANSIAVSKTSVWNITHDYGSTWKVLERRAMHTKERDVFPFMKEPSHIDWCHSNLAFLDEVAFDNRGMSGDAAMLQRANHSLSGATFTQTKGVVSRFPRCG
jgi:hypothetical protein